jgi:hypothetical protein
MAGLFDLFTLQKSTVQQQIDIIDEQMRDIRDNPEYSDLHKDREIRQLELQKAQIIEGAERAGLEAERFEREDDLWSD